MRGGGEHVEGPHAGGEEGLVGVAHRGVGDEQGPRVAHPTRETRGAEPLESLPRAGRRVAFGEGRELDTRVGDAGRFPVRAVHSDVGD